MRFYVLDGGGPKDSENTLNSILTKCGEKVFWQIGADIFHSVWLNEVQFKEGMHLADFFVVLPAGSDTLCAYVQHFTQLVVTL